MITCLDGFFSISVLQPAIQSQQTQTEIVYFFCHPLSTEINRTDHRSVRLGDNTMTVQPVVSPRVALQDASPHKAQSPPARGGCQREHPHASHTHLKREVVPVGHTAAPSQGHKMRHRS